MSMILKKAARISSASVSISLICLLLSPVVGGAPEVLQGTVAVDGLSGPVRVSSSNETNLIVTGFVRLDEKRTPLSQGDVNVRLDLEGGGEWTASVEPGSIPDMEVGIHYNIRIAIRIPPSHVGGQSQSYLVTAVFEDNLGSVQTSDQFVVMTEVDEGGDGGNSTVNVPNPERGFPIWILFPAGILFLLVLAGIWAYRNLEFVRERGGGRKIYLREKDSGRVLKKPPPDGP